MSPPELNKLLSAVRSIARGREGKSRPYTGEEARQLARRTLVAMGETWPEQNPRGKSE